MDKILCKMMDGLQVTLEERSAVLESIKTRISNGEQGDDIPIAMEALGCNYDAACEAVACGNKDAAIALLAENGPSDDDYPSP